MKANSTAVVALLAAGSAGLALLGSPVLRAAAAEGDLQSGVRSVTSALALIERNYAEPVSSEKLMYQGAIPGMLHTLDPHSSFLDPAEWREMQSRQSAQYFGVGMEINMDGAMVIVAQPMPGSPALAAGLRRGDVIVAIDGRDARSLDSTAVRDLLRGPRGTPVTISVRREGVSEPLLMTVVRAAIQTSFVDAFWLRRGIAYLGISTFEAQNVAADVEAALLKLGEPT
ncbi:MAG: PDZ domain-containing protein, partial [Acidobacteriota bacterium]|nr:PDZ domain-containing protein [Acidobacteriota bacterium]